MGPSIQVEDLENVFQEAEEGEEEEEVNDENKLKLMNESGQTDQERRQIRKSQRLLFKTIEEGGETLEVEQVRKENNEIFKRVLHTREAVLDGENLKLIAERATQQVDRLIQVCHWLIVIAYDCISYSQLHTIYPSRPLDTMQTNLSASWCKSAERKEDTLTGICWGVKPVSASMPHPPMFPFWMGPWPTERR